MFNLDCDSETLCRILSVLGSSAPLLPHSVVRTLTGRLKLKLSVLFSNGRLKKDAEKITWYIQQIIGSSLKPTTNYQCCIQKDLNSFQ